MVLPHLQAALNLARWLTGNIHDAEDVAQEASIRAFDSIDTLRGSDARSWLFRIVRNSAYNWLSRNKKTESLDTVAEAKSIGACSDPELIALRAGDLEAVRTALSKLPAEYREALVLREMEQLSYKEIAEVMSIPIGTVMSRLARARTMMRAQLLPVDADGGTQ